MHSALDAAHELSEQRIGFSRGQMISVGQSLSAATHFPLEQRIGRSIEVHMRLVAGGGQVWSLVLPAETALHEPSQHFTSPTGQVCVAGQSEYDLAHAPLGHLKCPASHSSPVDGHRALDVTQLASWHLIG